MSYPSSYGRTSSRHAYCNNPDPCTECSAHLRFLEQKGRWSVVYECPNGCTGEVYASHCRHCEAPVDSRWCRWDPASRSRICSSCGHPA